MFKKRSVLENRPCIVNKKIIIQFLFKVFKLDLTPWKFPLQAGTCIIFVLFMFLSDPVRVLLWII